jgi:hypothetical protein
MRVGAACCAGVALTACPGGATIFAPFLSFIFLALWAGWERYQVIFKTIQQQIIHNFRFYYVVSSKIVQVLLLLFLLTNTKLLLFK